MVYVDEMRRSRWRYAVSCHMFADDEQELIAFAAEIGLKERWWHRSRNGILHYDLVERFRKKALAAGAKEVRTKDMLRKICKN